MRVYLLRCVDEMDAPLSGLTLTHILLEKLKIMDADTNQRWLLTGFGVVIGGSCEQGSDESAEQSLSTSPGVVNELEEAEIEWQLLLRDAAMQPQPGLQKRPEAIG
jgi:hypothetical protein